MNKILMVMISAFLISGCAVKKDMIPVGGSKSDGTIKMGYTYNFMESPILDMNQAQTAATERCKMWDYEKAVPFGGETTQCVYAGGSCEVKTAFIDFQCVGKKAKD